MYVLNDGTEVTMAQIKTAFTSSLAVIVHGWRGDGLQVDTLGDCYSAWEETWAVAPKTLRLRHCARRGISRNPAR